MVQCRIPIADESWSTNSWGDSEESWRSNRITMACSTPAAEMRASFSWREVIDGGQFAGSSTQRG